MARRRPLDVSVSNVNRFACDWYIVVMSAAYSNGTLVVSNRYDHLGRRVQKIAMDGTHTFLYDGWRPVVETVARASGGTDRIEYHWGKDLSGTLDGAAGVGGLLYVRRNGAIYVPFYDAFGNVMGYWDSNDAVVAEYAYDAFGRMAAKSGIMADMFSIRYSTKYYDAETGMYYYGKRFYMTSLCRWLTRDPIEEEGGVNLYGFCGNDGVSIDPFGLTKISVSRTIKAMDGGSVRRNFLEIGVTILEAPKKGNQLNFIQLKKPTGKQWTVDQNVGFGPYYYTYMEKSALSRAYNWKENEIKLYDAPGGAIDRKTDFYTAVVEIERHCRSVGKRKILCADTVTVLYAISWSFYPYSSDQYQFTKSKSPGGIRPILRQLINNNKWQTEFCSNTEVKVK